MQSKNVNIDQESNKKERETYSLDHINSQDLHSERESLSYLLPTKNEGKLGEALLSQISKIISNLIAISRIHCGYTLYNQYKNIM